MSTTDDGVNLDQLRCAWQTDNVRCRYAGGIAHSKDGPWFCTAHFGCADPVFGAQVVDESVKRFPEIPDYSAGAVMERIRAVYRKGDGVTRGPVPANHRLAVPNLKFNAPARRGDDPDAIAERLALQDANA